ncbi:putative RNA-binding protein [Trypanosoma vivax]|nr:putative RNA-binding protein [Trypanosoma vivax]
MQTFILRNIPAHCMEDDLRRALLIYGTVLSAVVVPHLRQATVTMRSPHEAQAVLQQGCINLFGQSVTVEPAPYSPGTPQVGGGAAMMMPSHVGAARVNVVVEKCTYPVTKEVLTQVFSMVAPPINVVCSHSGPTTTGWVDFSDLATAQRAVMQLNKNSIYPDCCFMTLTVGQSVGTHHTMGGYTTQALPYHRGAPHHHHQSHHQSHGQHHPNGHHPHHVPLPPMHPLPGGNVGCGPMGLRGGRGRGRIGPIGRGVHSFGPGLPGAHPPYAAAACNGPPPEAVVIVSGVPDTVALHDLWVLLEVYGNVNSLKRQFSSKTNVIAHFQNVHDARLAVQHLQGCPFHGSSLSLKHFAGYIERGGKTEWNTGPATDPSTHAVLFSSGYHHRTKPTAAFNPMGRVRPSKNLFISNLTTAITDDEIKEIFTNAGFELEAFYRKNSNVVIVSLSDVENAVHALIAIHSQQIKERFLRVTFSHFPAAPRYGAEEGFEPAAAPESELPVAAQEANGEAEKVAEDPVEELTAETVEHLENEGLCEES